MSDDLVTAMLVALERADVPYMLVGSLASNFYGVPRSTRDADFVVELSSAALQRLRDALPAPLALDAQPAFEGVTGSIRYLVTAAGSPFVCELFLLGDDPHDQARFRRRQMVALGGRAVWIATPEDMIVTKLRWARDAARLKDRDDIRNMLAVQGNRLDRAYLDHWTATHETADLLDEIRATLPESLR